MPVWLFGGGDLPINSEVEQTIYSKCHALKSQWPIDGTDYINISVKFIERFSWFSTQCLTNSRGSRHDVFNVEKGDGQDQIALFNG